MQATPRKKLTDVSLAAMAVLEQQLGHEAPSFLRELSHSFFISLLSSPDWRGLTEAELSVLLATGVAEDLGGLQYYIPSLKSRKEIAQRTERALGLLKAGTSYREVAKQLGLSDSWVRKIERRSRAKPRVREGN